MSPWAPPWVWAPPEPPAARGRADQHEPEKRKTVIYSQSARILFPVHKGNKHRQGKMTFSKLALRSLAN